MAFAHYDIVGIAGAALIVLAYFLNQSRYLPSTDIRYPLINLAGAVLILYSLYYTFNLASFLIEVFWIGISVIGITKALRERQRTARREESR